MRAKPTGLGQRSGDGVYDRGSNVAGPRADGGEQESLLAERRELGNNLGERKVESAWPGKATGRDTVSATISMRTGFLVGTGIADSGCELNVVCYIVCRRQPLYIADRVRDRAIAGVRE